MFFAAAGRGDVETMRFCLTKGSGEAGGWETWPKGVRFEIEEAGWEAGGGHEGEAVVAMVRVVPAGGAGSGGVEAGRMMGK